MTKTWKSGSTIIEVLVAATLIATAILAGLSLSSTTQKQTDSSRYTNQATIYNNQAIDWMRNMRNVMGWANFANELSLDAGGSPVTYCLNTLPSTSSGFAALTSGSCGESDVIGTTVGYQREAVITLSGSPPSMASVLIHTYWSAKAHKITTEAGLTEW